MSERPAIRTAGEPAIRLTDITKLFGPEAPAVARAMADPVQRPVLLEEHRAALALVDVNLSVARGTIQVVMGLSGSGKSTLVRHINRLIEPTSGAVEVEGTDVLSLSPRALRAFRRERISMVFQRFALLPHKTAIENVAYGLKATGIARRERRDRAAAWMERVGLLGHEERFPSQLSGGMQQRVGLARALATEAPILLMDEAFSALDPLIRTEMQSLLLDLQTDLNRTIVFITHDLDEALRLGDRIAILKDGELVREGTGQDILLAPGSDYVSAFVGDVDQGRWVEIGALFTQAGRRRPAVSPSSDDRPALRLPARTSLREAARRLSAEGDDRAMMVDEDGAALHEVFLDEIVAAMTRPSRLEENTERRRREA